MKRLLACVLLMMLALTAASCSAMNKPALQPPAVHYEEEAVNEPEETGAAVKPAAEKAFSTGVWEGTTFISEYAGIRLTLPQDGWVIAGDEELGRNLPPEELAAQTELTDLTVQESETGASVILMYENLENYANAQGITAEEYAELLEDDLEENGEFALAVGKREKVELCGNEYVCVRVNVEGYGMEQAYLMRREDSRMVVLILTAEENDGMEKLMELFH